MKAFCLAALFVGNATGFMAPRVSMVCSCAMLLMLCFVIFLTHSILFAIKRSATVTHSSTVMRAKVSIDDLAPKEFQLEELEDKEESETEVWLNPDGSVTLGKTNGPSWKNYKGDWHIIETAQEGDRPFRMRLTRLYDAAG